MIVAWGLCLLVMAATIGEGGAAPASLLAQHALVCALLVMVLVRPRKVAWRPDPAIGACFVGFAALALTGALFANYAYAAFLVILELASFFAVFALSARTGPGWLPVLAACLGAAAFCQSILALVQRFAAGVLRPPGGFLNPNHLAAWLTAALFVIWGVAWARGRRARLAAAVATLPALATLVLVGSRGAVLGLAAGGAAAFACAAPTTDRRTLRRVAGVGLVLFAIGVAGVALRFRVRDPLGSARTEIWKASVQVLSSNVWLGTKPGQFESRAPNLNFAREDEPLRFEHGFSTPHSDVLRAAVEFGVPAAATLAVGLFLILRLVVRRVRRGALDAGGIGAVAGLAALFTQGTVNDLTETPALYLLGGALLGWLLAVESGARRRPFDAGRRALGWGAAALLVIGLLGADVAPYLAWKIQAVLPRGALTSAERLELTRARRLNPFQPDLSIRAADDLVANPADWTSDTYAAAREAAEESIRLAPDASAGWRALARVEGTGCRALFHDLGTRDRAAAAYLEAEARARHDPFLPLEAGNFLYLTGDVAGARRAALRALRIEPNAIPARLLLAEVSLADGGNAALAEARDQLKEAEALAVRFASTPKDSLYAMRLLTADPSNVQRIHERISQQTTQRMLDGRTTGD